MTGIRSEDIAMGLRDVKPYLYPIHWRRMEHEMQDMYPNGEVNASSWLMFIDL